MMWLDPTSMIFLAVVFIISITLHEFAHARTSVKFGDPTPKINGRLSLNPLIHLDIAWFLCIFFIQFGRWRPVQINPHYFDNPRKKELLVALAWPATNLLLAIFWAIIVILYVKITWWLTYFDSTDIVVKFRTLFSSINVALAIFNLLPLPQLDGFSVIKTFFPEVVITHRKVFSIIWYCIIAAIILPTPIRSVLVTAIQSASQFLYWVIHAVFTLLLW